MSKLFINMKKIFILLSFMLLLSITANSQTNINVWGGYSWINGIVGVEAQYGQFGIGAGYMPTKMPNTSENIPSWGGSVTYYLNNKSFHQYNDMFDGYYYGSIGVASAAYRYQNTLSEDVIVPLTYGMLGVKGCWNKFYLKAGLGYGWSKKYCTFTFEAGIGYILFINR